LTTCLRIADLTEFRPEDVLLYEVKKSGGVDKKQKDRIQTAINAIMNGGPLPGPSADARLVTVSQPFCTNLGQLDDLLQLARHHGVRGMKLSQGRSLMASYVPAGPARWSDDLGEGLKALESIDRRAMKRAGIADATCHVAGISGDTAARSPIVAPWSIYPFEAVDCAELICDRLIFKATISVDALADSLDRVGLRVETMLPAMGGELRGDAAVLRAGWRDRQLTVNADGLVQLLYELVEPNTWALGVREVLAGPSLPSEPVLVFEGEQSTWLGSL
jgi:hypothetical protein